MIVNTQKFLEDYKTALYEKNEIITARDNQIEKDTEEVALFIKAKNLPESILPEFMERVRQARYDEFDTKDINSKIAFYETYIEEELETVTETAF